MGRSARLPAPACELGAMCGMAYDLGRHNRRLTMPYHPHPIRLRDRPAVAVQRLMLTPRMARSALKVSLVVDTALNIINNGGRFWSHHSVNIWQTALNYVVRFCVSDYSAARHEERRSKGD